MLHRVEAVNSDGVFCPVSRVNLANNAHVSIILLSDEEREAQGTVQGTSGKDLKRLRTCIFAETAEEMNRAVESAFEQADPDEWR